MSCKLTYLRCCQIERENSRHGRTLRSLRDRPEEGFRQRALAAWWVTKNPLKQRRSNWISISPPPSGAASDIEIEDAIATAMPPSISRRIEFRVDESESRVLRPPPVRGPATWLR